MTFAKFNIYTGLSDSDLAALAIAPDKDKVAAVAAELSNHHRFYLDAGLILARQDAKNMSLTPERRMACFALSLFLEVEIARRDAPELAALDADL